MSLFGRNAKGQREVLGSRRLAAGISNFFDPMNFAAARATLSGDYATAARIDALQRQRRDERRESRAEALQREQLGNILEKDGDLGGEGFSEGQRALAMADPDSFFQNWNTRYRTDNLAEGHSRPDIGGGGAVRGNWRAPKTYTNGADLVTVDFNAAGGPQASGSMPQGLMGSGRRSAMAAAAGALQGFGFHDEPEQLPASSVGVAPPMMAGSAAPGVQTITMRTEAEQRAASLGLQPGTPEWDTYMRDDYLDAQGPTGVQLTREGHRVTMRGQDISSATTRRGQDMTDSRQRSDPRRVAPQPRQAPRPTPSTVVGDIMAKQARGEALTPHEQQVLREYQAGRGTSRGRGRAGRAGGQPGGNPGGATGGGNAARIYNRQTGVWAVLRNGQWVNERTGEAIR